MFAINLNDRESNPLIHWFEHSHPFPGIVKISGYPAFGSF